MLHRLIASTIISAALVTALLAPPAEVRAHDFEPERELLVQVFPEHVDIMIVYTEAPGERTDFFRTQFGFGVGGEVGELMREMARRAVLPRMLDGLQFEVVGEEPRTGDPEVEFRDHDTRLMAAAYVRYEIDELDDDKERTLVVRAKDRSFLPTPATIYGGDELQFVARDDESDPPPAKTYQLYRGKEVEVVFTSP